MGVLNAILDLIFPDHCLSCNVDRVSLCLPCASNFPIAERPSAPWIFPLFDYRNPKVKEAVHQLKYRRKKQIADVFGTLLYERILEELADLEKLENFVDPIYIPIPLSAKKYRERGFNQALLILKNTSRDFPIEENVLVKIKDTEAQARIHDRKMRMKNVIGSFTAKNTEKIKNRNIVLVDDVLTTGATLTEAKKVLREAGAKKVFAFTIAH